MATNRSVRQPPTCAPFVALARAPQIRIAKPMIPMKN
jgi:hypothetical protein